MLSIAAAAHIMNCPEHEIIAVADSPAGDMITTFDGNTFVVVPDDAPDFDGKTGLMFLVPPVPPNGRPYVGDFPVFTNPPDDAYPSPEEIESEGRELGIESSASKDELIDRARELGISVNLRWGERRLIEEIAAAEATLADDSDSDSDAAAADDDEVGA